MANAASNSKIPATQSQSMQSQKQFPQWIKFSDEFEFYFLSTNSSSQTGSVTAGNWQDETYQKIKSMHDMYYPELNEMYQQMAAKLQQHDSHPQQPKNEQLEKLRFPKLLLADIIMYLQTNKNDIQPHHKDKIVGVEKQIVNILNARRYQQQHPQMFQMHSNESQMNTPMQSMSIQGSMRPNNNSTCLQHNTLQQYQQQQQYMLRQPLIQQQQSGQLPGQEVMVSTAYPVLAVCILLLLVLMMLHCGGIMVA